MKNILYLSITLFLIIATVFLLFCNKVYTINDCNYLCGINNVKNCSWSKIECNPPEPIMDCE